MFGNIGSILPLLLILLLLGGSGNSSEYIG
jgi:hypothetical protein